jgi:hypothetical protein
MENIEDVEMIIMRGREIAKEALDYAKEHYPDASPYNRSAFANSVVYALTGFTGPYGGPSVREHVANLMLGTAYKKEDWANVPIEHLYSFVATWTLGPLLPEHIKFWRTSKSICHDTDPAEEDDLDKKVDASPSYYNMRLLDTTQADLKQIASMLNVSQIEIMDRLVKDERRRLEFGNKVLQQEDQAKK